LTKLLSRFAECIFWMARYVERANSLARVLDVNQSYSYDAKGGRNWESVLRLYSHGELFADRYDEITPENVLAFYLRDPLNPSSVRSCLRMARENARTVRPLISTEMWSQINAFYHEIKPLEPEDTTTQQLSDLAKLVKEGCQTHVGITMETFYRDEAWAFYVMGQQLERADQTTRLLDAKYQQLLPKGAGEGSAFDVSQWYALLRAAAGFQAFRREHPSSTRPEHVAAFLLFNSRFPRSLTSAVGATGDALASLRRDFNLSSGREAQRQLRSFQAELADLEIAEVLRDLHRWLDWAQLQLIRIGGTIAQDFFGSPAPAAA
jgi:uncharacterized alpha-E superfamily protein